MNVNPITHSIVTFLAPDIDARVERKVQEISSDISQQRYEELDNRNQQIHAELSRLINENRELRDRIATLEEGLVCTEASIKAQFAEIVERCIKAIKNIEHVVDNLSDEI